VTTTNPECDGQIHIYGNASFQRRDRTMGEKRSHREKITAPDPKAVRSSAAKNEWSAGNAVRFTGINTRRRTNRIGGRRNSLPKRDLNEQTIAFSVSGQCGNQQVRRDPDARFHNRDRVELTGAIDTWPSSNREEIRTTTRIVLDSPHYSPAATLQRG